MFFSWFKREKIAIFGGCLILSFGAIFPWYRLPQATLDTFGASFSFRNVGFVAAVLAVVGLMVVFGRANFLARLLFWMGFVVVLMFPYVVTTWSPQVAFIASGFYNQGEAVSTHIDKSFSDVQAQWKQNISLDSPQAPRTTFTMSISDSKFFQMPSWNKIILDGFGYRNEFFVFIGKGWTYSLFGIIICLIGFYLELQQSHDALDVFFKDLKLLMPLISVLVIIILFSFVGVNIVNYQLDTQYAQGNYAQVISTSKILESWYPPCQGDEAFLERLARAEFYISNYPDTGLIHFVKGLEHYKSGDLFAAEQFFQKSLDVKPNNFLTRGYLAYTLLMQGVNQINDPNARKPAGAAEYFEKTLKVYPGHVEALYNLMLARVVNGEFQESANIAQKIISGQAYFQEPRIGLLGQAYLHLAWAEYDKGNINKTWQRYRQSIDSSTWSKSPESES